MRIAAVMTCHNRREQTLECLSSLQQQELDDHETVIVPYVMDDGSTDGTTAAVRASAPGAIVLQGNGDLFWNGGMHEALARAYADGYDAYLWLNDDTVLDPHALRVLLRTWTGLARRGIQRAIVVGSTRDPETGRVTYGGRYRPAPFLRRLHFAVAPVRDAPGRVETMNGNVVLVPAAVVERIGNVDPGFMHSFGDEDFGLRAWNADCSVWTAPGTVGTCARDDRPRYGDRPLRDELAGLRHLTGGLHPSSWRRFAQRYGGSLWPLYFASPYLRRFLRILLARVVHR